MNQKLLLTAYLLFIGIGLSNAYCQKLSLWRNDGSFTIFEMDGIQKLSFSGTNLFLNNTSGTFETYDLSSVHKLTFDNTTGVNIVRTAKDITLYYNPDESAVYIQNVAAGTPKVTIYRINGVEVLSTFILSGNQTVDVSSLQRGFYLVKVNNVVFKFIKQ